MAPFALGLQLLALFVSISLSFYGAFTCVHLNKRNTHDNCSVIIFVLCILKVLAAMHYFLCCGVSHLNMLHHINFCSVLLCMTSWFCVHIILSPLFLSRNFLFVESAFCIFEIQHRFCGIDFF